jgi:hypothetical protein
MGELTGCPDLPSKTSGLNTEPGTRYPLGPNPVLVKVTLEDLVSRNGI